MTPTSNFSKNVLILFYVFIIINSITIYVMQTQPQYTNDTWVVFSANCMLFTLSVISLSLHAKGLKQKNASAGVNSIMSATLLKLIVLGGAAFVYIFVSGEHRSTYGILIGMALYIIYTGIEIWLALKINK